MNGRRIIQRWGRVVKKTENELGKILKEMYDNAPKGYQVANKIVDIAHSLSLMTKANGYCSHFYSVAQHSIHCYMEAKSRGYSKQVQLGCLLHDASESYISDLTRPVKRNMPEYFAIEKKLQSIIYDRFWLADLSDEERKVGREFVSIC